MIGADRAAGGDCLRLAPSLARAAALATALAAAALAQPAGAQVSDGVFGGPAHSVAWDRCTASRPASAPAALPALPADVPMPEPFTYPLFRPGFSVPAGCVLTTKFSPDGGYHTDAASASPAEAAGLAAAVGRVTAAGTAAVGGLSLEAARRLAQLISGIAVNAAAAGCELSAAARLDLAIDPVSPAAGVLVASAHWNRPLLGAVAELNCTAAAQAVAHGWWCAVGAGATELFAACLAAEAPGSAPAAPPADDAGHSAAVRRSCSALAGGAAAVQAAQCADGAAGHQALRTGVAAARHVGSVAIACPDAPVRRPAMCSEADRRAVAAAAGVPEDAATTALAALMPSFPRSTFAAGRCAGGLAVECTTCRFITTPRLRAQPYAVVLMGGGITVLKAILITLALMWGGRRPRRALLSWLQSRGPVAGLLGGPAADAAADSRAVRLEFPPAVRLRAIQFAMREPRPAAAALLPPAVREAQAALRSEAVTLWETDRAVAAAGVDAASPLLHDPRWQRLHLWVLYDELCRRGRYRVDPGHQPRAARHLRSAGMAATRDFAVAPARFSHERCLAALRGAIPAAAERADARAWWFECVCRYGTRLPTAAGELRLAAGWEWRVRAVAARTAAFEHVGQRTAGTSRRLITAHGKMFPAEYRMAASVSRRGRSQQLAAPSPEAEAAAPSTPGPGSPRPPGAMSPGPLPVSSPAPLARNAGGADPGAAALPQAVDSSSRPPSCVPGPKPPTPAAVAGPPAAAPGRRSPSGSSSGGFTATAYSSFEISLPGEGESDLEGDLAALDGDDLEGATNDDLSSEYSRASSLASRILGLDSGSDDSGSDSEAEETRKDRAARRFDAAWVVELEVDPLAPAAPAPDLGEAMAKDVAAGVACWSARNVVTAAEVHARGALNTEKAKQPPSVRMAVAVGRQAGQVATQGAGIKTFIGANVDVAVTAIRGPARRLQSKKAGAAPPKPGAAPGASLAERFAPSPEGQTESIRRRAEEGAEAAPPPPAGPHSQSTAFDDLGGASSTPPRPAPPPPGAADAVMSVPARRAIDPDAFPGAFAPRPVEVLASIAGPDAAVRLSDSRAFSFIAGLHAAAVPNTIRIRVPALADPTAADCPAGDGAWPFAAIAGCDDAAIPFDMQNLGCAPAACADPAGALGARPSVVGDDSGVQPRWWRVPRWPGDDASRGAELWVQLRRFLDAHPATTVGSALFTADDDDGPAGLNVLACSTEEPPAQPAAEPAAAAAPPAFCERLGVSVRLGTGSLKVTLAQLLLSSLGDDLTIAHRRHAAARFGHLTPAQQELRRTLIDPSGDAPRPVQRGAVLALIGHAEALRVEVRRFAGAPDGLAPGAAVLTDRLGREARHLAAALGSAARAIPRFPERTVDGFAAFFLQVLLVPSPLTFALTSALSAVWYGYVSVRDGLEDPSDSGWDRYENVAFRVINSGLPMSILAGTAAMAAGREQVKHLFTLRGNPQIYAIAKVLLWIVIGLSMILLVAPAATHVLPGAVMFCWIVVAAVLMVAAAFCLASTLIFLAADWRSMRCFLVVGVPATVVIYFSLYIFTTVVSQTAFNWALIVYRRRRLGVTSYLGVVSMEYEMRSLQCYYDALWSSTANMLQTATLLLE